MPVKITPIKGYTTENLMDLKLLQLSLHPRRIGRWGKFSERVKKDKGGRVKITMRIGVLSGGGDVPGLNPAIRGCVLRAMDFG